MAWFKTDRFGLERYPTLAGCIKNLWTPPGQGLCFHRALALTIDMPTATLVIGTLRPANDNELTLMPLAATEPFLHAWVEVGDKLCAPTMFETFGELRWISNVIYYEVNGVKDPYRCPRRDVMRIARLPGVKSHLRLGSPCSTGPIAPLLLSSFGVPFRISSGGGVLPEDPSHLINLDQHAGRDGNCVSCGY